MKNKDSFLKELQSRLSVLEEAEQQDILAEYAQHIDLRVAGGLTEEEAVQDFGDIDQLAAEILSAYHVKATYQEPKEKKRLPSPWPAIRRGASGVGGFFRRLGGGIADGFRRLADCVKRGAGWCGAHLKKLFSKRPKAEEEAEPQGAQDIETAERQEFTEHGEETTLPEAAECIEKMEVEPSVEHTEKRGTAWGALCQGTRRLGHGLWRLCRNAAWLAWNLLLLLCALPFVGLGLLALVCLGALAMLLAQGYPLAGVTLCCLGGAACCVGILGLGSGLIWHRAGLAAGSAEGPLTEETAERPEREGGMEDEA